MPNSKERFGMLALGLRETIPRRFSPLVHVIPTPAEQDSKGIHLSLTCTFQLPSHLNSCEEMFINQMAKNTEVMKLLGTHLHLPIHPSLEADGSTHTAWIIFKSGMLNSVLEEFASSLYKNTV